MPLVVHHLGHSQSDRVVWLCEELGVPYELKKYDRSPMLSPPSYLALHPIGAAPVIEDTDAGVKIAESAACMEYIVQIYGKGKSAWEDKNGVLIKPGEEGYADYLYWFHFGNGTLQPAVGRAMILTFAGIHGENNQAVNAQNRIDIALSHLDARLKSVPWLAGEKFTMADIMVPFSVTGMREFYSLDLSKYEGILGWLDRIWAREGYRKCREKGDPDLDWEALMRGPPPPLFKALRERIAKELAAKQREGDGGTAKVKIEG